MSSSNRSIVEEFGTRSVTGNDRQDYARIVSPDFVDHSAAAAIAALTDAGS